MIFPKARGLYHGIATLIDHNFDMEQKKLLCSLLNRIEEKLPWAGTQCGRHAAKASLRRLGVMPNERDGD